VDFRWRPVRGGAAKRLLHAVADWLGRRGGLGGLRGWLFIGRLRFRLASGFVTGSGKTHPFRAALFVFPERVRQAEALAGVASDAAEIATLGGDDINHAREPLR